MLLCACTPLARQKLTKDFSTATEMGVASVAAAVADVQHANSCPGATQRPLGKKYRALVSGLIDTNEVRLISPLQG